MSFKYVCPYCEEEAAQQVEYSESVKFGRKNVSVKGLKKIVCSHCGSESVPIEFYDLNAELMSQAADASAEVVSVAALRDLREDWSISQKDASLIFGAGQSSFGKWESKQSNISTPAALLIKVACHFPIVVPYLAKLANVDLPRESLAQKSMTSPSLRVSGAYETVSSMQEDSANGIYIHVPSSRGRSTTSVNAARGAAWESTNLKSVGGVRSAERFHEIAA